MSFNFPTELTQFLKKLPTDPGVYRMLDVQGTILYVGKAFNLKKRVLSYFNNQNTSLKTQSLVSQIHSIEISVTRSETEALLLELSLIKTLKPKYNILLRDDKTYPYIYVSSHPDFPRMVSIRCKKKPNIGEVFGPYPSAVAVKETLLTIQKIFQIRNCSDIFFNARSRPCLQYQIKRCTAPCVQYISPEAYKKSVRDALRFLQGKSHLILDDLAGRMEACVKQLHFEEAARFRDQIKHLRLIQESQGIMQSRGDADVIAIAVSSGFACIQCVTIREGQVLASQSFYPAVPVVAFDEEHKEEDLWQNAFEAFIGFYYLDNPERIPALIITHKKPVHPQLFMDVLSQKRGKKCRIKVNGKGNTTRWMDFTLNNLHGAVIEYNNKHSTVRLRFKALEEALSLSKPIERMECFDISHTQGEATVASNVVFLEDGPAPKAYRRFNIEGITPGDDYAAMKQALTRRFKHAAVDKVLPTLLIIDGGIGQVNIASHVLESLGITDVMILGIAKGPTRKAGLEHLIWADKSFSLPEDSKALHLIQHIRDEAHRFAITAHRKRRQKARVVSTLEQIEGIGAKRRHALLLRFGGMRELTRAPLEEIAKVQGISAALAKRIYEYLHGDT
jgi:excinuclease ABC subunit C